MARVQSRLDHPATPILPLYSNERPEADQLVVVARAPISVDTDEGKVSVAITQLGTYKVIEVP